MNTIYELNSAYVELQNMAQEAETQDEVKALEDTIAAITDAIEVKGENYAKLIKSIDAENDGIDKEIKRLQAIKKRNENLVTRLKNNIDESLKVQGLTKIKCGTFTFSYRKSKAVEVMDLAKIPTEYLKVEYSARKTDIKNAIQNGEVVPGAELVEKSSLQLR